MGELAIRKGGAIVRWLVVLILFCFAGCQDGPKREKVGEVPLGYRGKARLNPYLAAERYLEKKGWSAKSSRTWSNYREETSIIFMPGSYLQTKGMAMRALDWVSDGGTLVLTVQGGEPERNDFTDDWSGSVPEEGEYSGLDELFETLEIGRETRLEIDTSGEMEEDGYLARGWELSRTDDSYGGHALEFEGNVALTASNGWDWIPKVQGASRMVGTSFGFGEVIVLAHARPFRNPYLARADHADFLEALAETYGGGDIVFLYGSSTSFFGLLWKEGWMVVIGGLVVLACWLWMRIPRFGPVMRDLEVKRKPYGDALTTSARYLWRMGQLESLLRPLRDRLESEGGESADGYYERLAGESGMKSEEVKEALMAPPPKEPGQILKITQKLQTLFKR